MLQAWPESGWLTLGRPSHCHNPKPWTTERPGPKGTGRTGTCGVWTTSFRSLETCCRTRPLPHPDGCTQHASARRITCRNTLMDNRRLTAGYQSWEECSCAEGVTESQQKHEWKNSSWFCWLGAPLAHVPHSFFGHVVLQIHRSSTTVKIHWHQTVRSNRWEETIRAHKHDYSLKFTFFFFYLLVWW